MMLMIPLPLPKAVTILFSTLLCGILALPGNAAAALVDKVVAVVNDDVITLSEVEEEASRLYQTLANTQPSEVLSTSMAQLREETIDALIDRRLINQRAKSTNTTVNEEELVAAMESTRTRMGLDPADFRKRMERSGMTEDNLKKQLRDQILQSKLVSSDVRAKTVVTEEMVLAYYNEGHTSRTDKGNLYLLQMGFSWSKDNKDQEKLATEKGAAKKRAETAWTLVKDGQDFKEVAKKFSELPSAVDGGDLGVLHLDDLAQVTRSTVESLKPGELSKIVETSGDYQFFKILPGDDGAAKSASFEKVKEEIREKLYQEKLKAAYADWVKKLRESAYIQKL
jgi:peptidyl-prolyl cis-trans isomerase SurA